MWGENWSGGGERGVWTKTKKRGAAGGRGVKDEGRHRDHD